MYFDQAAFGKRLRELRKKENHSQEELAEKLCISTVHYGGLERGTRGCSIDLLLELAEIFRVSTDYLLTGRCADREADLQKLEKMQALLDELKRSI